MRRLLPLLLSLTIAVAALAQPVISCVTGTAAVGAQAHNCCEAQLASSPAPVCCVVSQPVRDRALAESRYLHTHQSAETTVPPIRFHVPPLDLARRRAGPPSAPAVAPVPLYLQQRALLI